MSFMLNATPLKKLPRHDLEHMREAQSCVEVAYANMQHMLKTESQHMALVKLLYAKQTEITRVFRAQVVDFMIGVHLHFGFMPETLFIAVNLLDRYTQQCPIALANYQLIAVAALYTASRY
jgi:hypothetical protein